MAIGPKTKSDIQFTRNVLESLGEWERAARMARAMIDLNGLTPELIPRVMRSDRCGPIRAFRLR